MTAYYSLNIKKYYIWIGLIFALALRIGFSLNTNIMAFGDAGDYSNAAIQILKNHTYPERGVMLFFRPPLYPLFLAILYKASFQNFLLVKIIQALIGMLSCYFIMRIGQKIFNKRTGHIAFILASINPFFIHWSGFLETETLFMFLFVTSIFLLILFDRTNLKRYLILSAFLLALSALTRPIAVLFAPFLFIYLFLRPKKDYASCIKNMVIFALCFICVIMPWTARNYRVFKEVILINNAEGPSFFQGNNKILASIASSKTRQEYQRHTREFMEYYYSLVDEMKYLPNSEMQDKFYSLSFEFIKNETRTWLYLKWKNFLEFWRPYLNPFVYPEKAVILSFIYLFPVIFLGLFEIARQFLIKEANSLDILLVFIILAVGSSQFLIVQPMIRYRMSVIDPFLIIFASHAFCLSRQL